MAILDETGLTHYDTKLKSAIEDMAPLFITGTTTWNSATTFTCTTDKTALEVYNAILAGRLVVLQLVGEIANVSMIWRNVNAPYTMGDTTYYGVIFSYFSQAEKKQYLVQFALALAGSTYMQGSITSY